MNSKYLEPKVAVALACVCAALGLFSVSNTVSALLTMWRTDDLKSMGLVVPLVSAALILRAWRSLGWETEGSWWGLAGVAGIALTVFLRDQMMLIVTVNKGWLVEVPPVPLLAVGYAAGMVLLFGGWKLLRAAWFGVLFMWEVIPVPQTFSRAVDLPLQHAAALVARGFAHLLGEKLTEDNLRLMFTPDYGMFIAPGCNGIRGAVTLGLAALVVSYVYRFRWYQFPPVVIGAVLLGYMFNFLRLCLLVVYYKLTLGHEWFEVRAETADYVIGGTLFVLALVIFFAVAERLRRPAPPAVAALPEAKPFPALPYLLRAAAVVVVAGLFGADAMFAARHTAPSQAAALPAMPQKIGTYTLVRTWTDTLLDGVIVYDWGEYAGPDPAAPHVSLGISPVFDVHDAEVCHMARGESPLWHGQIDAKSPGGPMHLTGALYDDGNAQRLEASALCDGGTCGQYSETGQHVTVIFAHPHRTLPMQADTSRPVPVMLVVEGEYVVGTANVVEPRLASALDDFLAQADLVKLTVPFSRR